MGKDTLALLPTGGGKSICYQVPALAIEGICIVISPLIALMKDQVAQLNQRGIKAACLYSGMKSYEQAIVLNNSTYGNIKLLYVAPERLQSRTFIEHFRQMKVSLIAVDEAHCISQWGYDFRPSYCQISKIRQYHEEVPILALTATATPEVVSDIKDKLLFKPNHETFQTSFARKNLCYVVYHESDKLGRLLRVLNGVNGSAIIYVRNRRKTKEIASFLNGRGIPSSHYHAGLSAKERDTNQQRWMNHEVDVMVATNAFGMGIDKPDVRVVVHLDIPTSPEAYFQEAGRAGRDGMRSFAVLLYDDTDLEHLINHIDIEYPSLQQIRNAYRAICNYYNVPIGSGEGANFDLDITKISQNYRLNPLELYNSLAFLEKEGLISIPTMDETTSRLHIPIARNVLYKYQVENPRYGDLIELIVRSYGGLFTEYTPISERFLAQKCYAKESEITKTLLHLDALGIVSYKPLPTQPQIYFTCDRIDAKDIYLREENYGQLKKRAQERLNAMHHYIINNNECRSQQLLRYFGEESNECNNCDICITHRKRNINEDQIQQIIIETLQHHPMTINELLRHICTGSNATLQQENIIKMVRLMLDHRTLLQDKEFRLYLP